MLEEDCETPFVEIQGGSWIHPEGDILDEVLILLGATLNPFLIAHPFSLSAMRAEGRCVVKEGWRIAGEIR